MKERLRIRYGDQFRVLVESQEGQGTNITILIPGGYEEKEVVI